MGQHEDARTPDSTPDSTPDFTPDQDQQRVVEKAAEGAHGPLLVLGGPGTGKTTVITHLALRFLQSGHDSHELLVLSPSRTSSARLRDAIESRWAQDPQDGTLTDQPSRSFASYAFAVIAEARRRGLLDFTDRAPRLLSGAEQDRQIAALLSAQETDVQWRVVDPATAGTERERVRVDLRLAAGTAGFRQEIRELFDRASEYGVSPEELIAWGEDAAAGRGPGYAAWKPAGELYGLYLDLLGQQAPHAFDPSGLIARACDLLEDHPQLLAGERHRLRLILVDDVQEANPNVWRLLRLIGAGGPVIACANPDVAVQGFRGARPDLMANWTGDSDDHLLPAGVAARGRRGSMRPEDPAVGKEPEVLSLAVDHRMSREIAQVYGSVVERIGSVGDPLPYRRRWAELAAQRRTEWAEQAQEQHEHQHPSQAHLSPGPRRNFPEDVDTSALGVSVSIVGSEQHAEQMILQEVLQRHHRGGVEGAGVPLGQIAVIARNGAAVHQVSRLFAGQGLPVARSMSEVVLREETAVAPLLRLMRAVTSTAPVANAESGTSAEAHSSAEADSGIDTEANPETVTHPVPSDHLDLPAVLALLSGPYGAVDAITMRRIRRLLLGMERTQVVEGEGAAEQPRTSDQLLVAAVNEPQDPVTQLLMTSEHRALRGLQRLVRMVQAAREAAEEPGAGPGEVLWALWQASARQARWVSQSQGGGEPARRANRDLDAVVALFEAAERYSEQLPGQSIQHFVTYIEEMELPMDTLAETSTVREAISVLTPATAVGREFDTVILIGMQDGVWPNLTPRGELLGSSVLVDMVSGAADRGSRSARAKRMQVLQDEYRLFAAAVSRARRRLVGIGITSTDETPSLLIDLLVPAVLRTSAELARPRPMTAPTLVAQLRRTVEAHAGRAAARGEPAEKNTDLGGLDELSDVSDAAEKKAEKEKTEEQETEEKETEEREAEEAARALAILGQARAEATGETITGAAPQHWWGLVDPARFAALITEEELDAGAPLRLSPSAVEKAQNRPLEWFIDAVGGSPTTDQARDLGTLIHSIAEDHPRPEPGASPLDTADTLRAVLTQRWGELGLDPQSYDSSRSFARAEQMMGRLAWYIHAAQEAGREHLLSEVHITAGMQLPVRGTLREITVSGSIDRLEVDEDGEYYIVDYKTGTRTPRRCAKHPKGSSQTAPEDCELCGHAQLGVYQQLVRTPQDHKTARHDGTDVEITGETAGAALVFLGEDLAKVEGIEYRQQAVSGVPSAEDWPAGAGAWPDLALIEAAQTVTAGQFSVHHTEGAQCRAGVLCPICASGRAVTQPIAE